MLTLFSAKSPGDLAIDKEERKLYWTDIEMKKIEYGDLAGESRVVITLKGIVGVTVLELLWAGLGKKCRPLVRDKYIFLTGK